MPPYGLGYVLRKDLGSCQFISQNHSYEVTLCYRLMSDCMYFSIDVELDARYYGVDGYQHLNNRVHDELPASCNVCETDHNRALQLFSINNTHTIYACRSIRQ